MQCMQNAVMPVQITIRNVSRKVRDELASRAALRHQSMQEYLRGELERIAARPTIENWLSTVRDRKATAGTRIPSRKIVGARNADRK